MSAGPLNSPMLGLGAGPDAMLASGLARSIKENGADGFPTASRVRVGQTAPRIRETRIGAAVVVDTAGDIVAEVDAAKIPAPSGRALEPVGNRAPECIEALEAQTKSRQAGKGSGEVAG